MTDRRGAARVAAPRPGRGALESRAVREEYLNVFRGWLWALAGALMFWLPALAGFWFGVLR